MFFARFTPNMTAEQRDFIRRLVPWSRFLAQQTIAKGQVFKRYPNTIGIHPSVIVADIILISDWGTHPVSKWKFRNRELGNNLCLLPCDKNWEREHSKYENVDYKLFVSWEHFFSHLSDLLVFGDVFGKLLNHREVSEQINYMSLFRSDLIGYNEDIVTTINKYNLSEFNLYGATTNSQPDKEGL